MVRLLEQWLAQRLSGYKPQLMLFFRIPPNCTFEVDDLEKPWTWKQPFDFIHSSNVGQGIRDWPQYIKKMYENLTPGGVVQLHETEMTFSNDDDSLPKGGYLERYYNDGTKALQLAGLVDKSDKLEGYLKDAGFVDVKVVVKKLPVGPWPKQEKQKVTPTSALPHLCADAKICASRCWADGVWPLLSRALRATPSAYSLAFWECRMKKSWTFARVLSKNSVAAMYMYTQISTFPSCFLPRKSVPAQAK
jgi:hypothetical protein